MDSSPTWTAPFVVVVTADAGDVIGEDTLCDVEAVLCAMHVCVFEQPPMFEWPPLFFWHNHSNFLRCLSRVVLCLCFLTLSIKSQHSL